MKDTKYAKLFMKMARYDCTLLTVLNAARTVLTVAVVLNMLISGVYVASVLKK